jgi:hypothetical protein
MIGGVCCVLSRSLKSGCNPIPSKACAELAGVLVDLHSFAARCCEHVSRAQTLASNHVLTRRNDEVDLQQFDDSKRN